MRQKRAAGCSCSAEFGLKSVHYRDINFVTREIRHLLQLCNPPLVTIANIHAGFSWRKRVGVEPTIAIKDNDLRF